MLANLSPARLAGLHQHLTKSSTRVSCLKASARRLAAPLSKSSPRVALLTTSARAGGPQEIVVGVATPLGDAYTEKGIGSETEGRVHELTACGFTASRRIRASCRALSRL